jgi:hypothetical protein
MPSAHAAAFNEMSLRAMLDLFSSKTSPPVSTVRGPYEAEFVGPGWLRSLAAPTLGLLGAKGWWGKNFDGEGGGHNLFLHKGAVVPRVAMTIGGSTSLVDGKPGIAITYPDSGLPWNVVRGEIRSYIPGLLIGVVAIDLPGLRSVALPYLLCRRRDIAL